MLPMREPVTELMLEAPAGLIRVRADCADGKVTGVTFRNVPAFATHLDAPSRSRSSAPSTVDVAYGGMFYVIADAEALGLRLTPDEGRDIVRISEMIKAAAREQLPVVHPEHRGSPGSRSGSCRARRTTRRTHAQRRRRSRPARSTGDRPSTWTGRRSTVRRAAPARARDGALHAQGRCARPAVPPRGRPGHGVHGRLVEETRVGARPRSCRRSPARPGSPASPVRPRPDDPFPEGFTVGDIWVIVARRRADRGA